MNVMREQDNKHQTDDMDPKKRAPEDRDIDFASQCGEAAMFLCTERLFFVIGIRIGRSRREPDTGQGQDAEGSWNDAGPLSRFVETSKPRLAKYADHKTSQNDEQDRIQAAA